MEIKPIKRRVFFLKVARRVRLPASRLKKCFKLLTKNYKDIFIMILITIIGITVVVIYFKYYIFPVHARRNYKYLNLTTTTEMYVKGSPMVHVRLNQLYKDNKALYGQDYSFELEEKYQRYPKMLNTPGCGIPLSMVNYKKDVRNTTSGCGKRAIFLDKIEKNRVKAYINKSELRKQLFMSPLFYCCYRFMQSFSDDWINTKINSDLNCPKLSDGMIITLETNFIQVYCYEHDPKKNITRELYTDSYAFVMKKNSARPKTGGCDKKYNVLLLGISSMSLPRFVQLMPRTVNFFKDNFWFGFRGYNKIAESSFHNLMAVFSGKAKSPSDICAKNFLECIDLIWNNFREIGYVTAIGEEHRGTPDAFIKNMKFTSSPTDHYINVKYKTNKTCAGKEISTKQLLNFAFDFVNTYRNNNFFGFFWSQIFNYNIDVCPEEVDIVFENFFNQLQYTRAMDNSFIFFFSDHGIHYGDRRLSAESYYDERMPMFFMWAPRSFSRRYPTKMKYTAINQFRLTTTYDLYNTLSEINLLSRCINANKSISVTRECLKCHSLFEEISKHRKCTDIINDHWCTCHNLYPLDFQDPDGLKRVTFVVSHIKWLVRTIRTKSCWKCKLLSLKKVIRIHFYYNSDKTGLYYVVAFSMNPGDLHFEATVLKREKKIEIVGSVSGLTSYEGLGDCVIDPKYRNFCVCQRNKKCDYRTN